MWGKLNWKKKISANSSKIKSVSRKFISANSSSKRHGLD